MNPVEVFLEKLEGVRKAGKGWIARCPGHDDRSASLSVCGGDDGRVLIRCFAGCSPAEVVAGCGLELADLFPPRMKPTTPEARRALRAAAREAEWKAALRVLDREATIVLICAGTIERGEVFNDEARRRLITASQRIADARAVLT